MSVYSLTKGSEHALKLLALTGGNDTLLLIQPAREIRAEIQVQPAAEQKLEAALRLREQRHSMTLQTGDSANAQHLADWVEAIANGTLDTAQAIPQRQSVLLPCCRCEGEAIAYSYLAPAPAQHDLHGVKCRHRDCQSLERAATAAAAADAWNAIQREELAEAAEPAPAQDEPMPDEVHQMAFEEGQPAENGDGYCFTAEEFDLFVERLLSRATRPARTGQQPVAWGAFHFGGSRSGKLYSHCETEQQIDSYIADVHRSNDSITLRKAPLYDAPIAQTAPDGWQLVPMAPTQAMREAFHAATERYEDGYGESPDSQWHAMLRAARATSPTA